MIPRRRYYLTSLLSASVSRDDDVYYCCPPYDGVLAISEDDNCRDGREFYAAH